jgi:hypothetical protein
MIDIGFEWTRGPSYECAVDGGVKILRQVGQYPKRKDRVLQPLTIGGDKPLYARFANLDGSPESYVRFAKAYGFLSTAAQAGASEDLEVWQSEIKKLRQLMSLLNAEGEKPGGLVRSANGSRVRLKLTSIDVSLLSAAPDEQFENPRRPTLVLQPADLLDAMHLQLAKFVASEGSLVLCKQCNEPFERGASESRRSIAVFCSEKCKNRFHYLERAKR